MPPPLFLEARDRAGRMVVYERREDAKAVCDVPPLGCTAAEGYHPAGFADALHGYIGGAVRRSREMPVDADADREAGRRSLWAVEGEGMSDKRKERCATCRWWGRQNTGKGQCHFSPPTAVPGREGYSFPFPHTFPNDFCSQWETIPGEEPRTTWMPIETAGKNDCEIVLLLIDGEDDLDPIVGYFANHEWISLEANAKISPRFWMPIPEAPKDW